MNAIRPANSSRPKAPVRALANVALAFLVCAPAAAQPPSRHQWLGADGEPLPFADDAALVEFLRTADVVDEEPIGTGINQSVLVTLERDGVRAHTIFREVDHRERNATINRVTYQMFADSYKFEPAAYEISKLIGLPIVPPATFRDIRGRNGSLQIGLEDAIDEDGPGFQPPSPLAWSEQISDMYFFDNLIYNIDRNPDNILVTPDYHLWLITLARFISSTSSSTTRFCACAGARTTSSWR